MSDFLSSMVRDRLARVRQDAETGPSAAALRGEAEARRGDRRPFEAALRRDPGAPLRVIAEVKRASPSAGTLQTFYDPAALAEEYARCGAAAISVLTEPSRFLGGIEHLTRVREAVPLPALLKDFVVHERQIFEAGARGADAVLLLVAALENPQLSEFAALIVELSMTPLVEIHEPREIDAAVSVPGVLGVNNRDLRTLAMRPGHAESLLPLLPADRVRVAESGYKDRNAILQLERTGADAVLVGETLLRASTVAAGYAALFGGKDGAVARVEGARRERP
ncbi:MAG TPA: indole-3-glycerol phosphate synthase TrpC [Candidatus Limnocylindrales bacterium]|nr:indole-3-glycerol phosphate synthase TrpC [Candidatus Limnocylindrales bacterium]